MRLLMFLLLASTQPPITFEQVCELRYDPPPARRVTLVQCEEIFSDSFE